MRTAIALVAALLLLAPACKDDPSGPPADDRSRGERCDDMQACGRAECAAEMDAAIACATDPLCSDDMHLLTLETVALCLTDNDCNTTSCDLVAAFTREDGDIQDDCTVDGDGEILEFARDAMFFDDRVVECQALE